MDNTSSFNSIADLHKYIRFSKIVLSENTFNSIADLLDNVMILRLSAYGDFQFYSRSSISIFTLS